jgi:hypothetical protein
MARITLGLMVVVIGAGSAWSEAPPEVAVGAKTRESLRADAVRLMRALENLQEAIVQDLSGGKERSLYRKADAALKRAEIFRRALKENVTREQLWKAYDELDARIQELLKAAEALGADARALRREAARVDAAEEELQYTLSAGNAPLPRKQGVLKRQARRLLTDARELERTAQYALSSRGAASAGDFRRFVEAVAALQKGVEAGASPEQLRKDYDKVGAAWLKAVAVVRQLKASENLYLLRVAARTDRALARMHVLLGIPGKRPGLILQT